MLPLTLDETRTSVKSSGRRRQDLDVFDVKNQHRMLGNASQVLVAVAQMRACSKSPRPAGTHALQSIAETCNEPPVSDGQNLIFLLRQKLSTIQLNVVTQPHPVSLLQFGASSHNVRNDFDSRLCHEKSAVGCSCELLRRL